MGSWLTVLASALGLLLGGCAALEDGLRHTEDSYDQSRYDEAMVWLVYFERDEVDMDLPMRARYHYLRGMSANRMGDRDQALYELALARALAEGDRLALRDDWRASVDRTLAELTPVTASSRARERQP